MLRKNKNELTIAAGTIIAQILPFLIAPILTRLFSPEDFGTFGTYYACLMILSVFMNGKYETTLLIHEDEKELSQLVFLNLFTSLFFISLFTIVGGVFMPQVEAFFAVSGLRAWWFYVPISLLGIALFQTAYFWHNRGGEYQLMSASRVIRSAASSGSTVGLGFGGVLNATGLILGDAIGQILGGLYLWKKQKIVFQELQWTKVKYFGRLYVHFPLFLIPAALANKAANYLPILFIGSLSAPLAGFFTLAQRMVYASSGTVAAAFGDVFKQKAAAELRTDFSCRKTFIQTFKKLLLMVGIPYGILQFFAELLFSFIFGSNWAMAGTYAQILAPMFLLQFVVSPLSNVLIIREKQRLNLSLQLGLVVGVITAFYYGIVVNEDVILALQIFTFVNCLKYIIELFFSWKFTVIRKN